MILLEVVFKQDSIKSINKRSSLQILDFFGNVGGFQQALAVFGIFSAFYSSKVNRGFLAQTFFVRKRSKIEIRERRKLLSNRQRSNKVHPEKTKKVSSENQQQLLKETFAKISFGDWYKTLWVMCVSTSFVCWPCRLCCCSDAQRKNRLLDKAEEKLRRELDLTEIVAKLRNSHALLKSIVGR